MEEQELELEPRGPYDRATPDSVRDMWHSAIQLALLDATRLKKRRCCDECWGLTYGPCPGAVRWIFDDEAFVDICDAVGVDWRQARRLVQETWCEQRYHKLLGIRWRSRAFEAYRRQRQALGDE